MIGAIIDLAILAPIAATAVMWLAGVFAAAFK
jgi:hypothetical protein